MNNSQRIGYEEGSLADVDDTAIPRVYLFPVDSDSNVVPGPQRAPYTKRRRIEVRAIRREGACLRCHLLKKPVSAKPQFLILYAIDMFTVLRRKTLSALLNCGCGCYLLCGSALDGMCEAVVCIVL